VRRNLYGSFEASLRIFDLRFLNKTRINIYSLAMQHKSAMIILWADGQPVLASLSGFLNSYRTVDAAHTFQAYSLFTARICLRAILLPVSHFSTIYDKFAYMRSTLDHISIEASLASEMGRKIEAKRKQRQMNQ